MSTAIIEIKNDLAYGFLYNLERMDVLRVISRQNAQNSNRQKLSQRFAGTLSSERVDELQSAINKMELYFTLISRNFKDFLRITELNYINPYLSVC